MKKQLFTDENLNHRRLYTQYSLLAKNRFIWKNLPKGIESRHIEEGLFQQGQVAFFNDDLLGFLCLPCSPVSNINVYGDSNDYVVTGVGYSKTYKSDEIVRILSNDNCTPSSIIISHYAKLIGDIEITSQMNLNQQKFPYIIPVTKNNELSMKNTFKKIEKGENAIFIDEKLSNGGDVGIKVVKTEAPYLLDKLQTHKKDLTCELLTLLGLNNTNNDKHERLLVDEVNINNGEILMNLELEYKNRLIACEQINAIYNLNITVEKTIDILGVDFKGSDKKKEVI